MYEPTKEEKNLMWALAREELCNRCHMNIGCRENCMALRMKAKSMTDELIQRKSSPIVETIE